MSHSRLFIFFNNEPLSYQEDLIKNIFDNGIRLILYDSHSFILFYTMTDNTKEVQHDEKVNQ